MTQTRLGSLIEAWTNTALGFLVNLAASFVVYPLFGVSFSLVQNLGIVTIFTVISVLRGYCVRRWFNRLLQKARM